MRKLAAIFVLAGLAACSVPSASPPDAAVYNTDFDRDFALRAGVGGSRTLYTVGDPPQALEAQSFANALRVPGWYPPTVFEAKPPSPNPRGYYFVASFGTDANTELCARPVAGADPDLLAIALCRDFRLISRAALRIDESAPLEPQLSTLMRALLPLSRRGRFQRRALP
ncbi:MAG: hypothetical protein AAGC92_00600 [Pseudomonadota bacterium]